LLEKVKQDFSSDIPEGVNVRVGLQHLETKTFKCYNPNKIK
jgi:hypothetical protein